MGTVRCRYNAVSFLPNYREGEVWSDFCEFNLWKYFVSVNAVLHEIAWYFVPRYNDTRLYKCANTGSKSSVNYMFSESFSFQIIQFPHASTKESIYLI